MAEQERRFSLNYSEVTELAQAIQDYAGDAEDAINEVLHGYGAQEAAEEITRLMPVSGRVWKGKKAAAKKANPLVMKGINLGFIIYTKTAYNYLYFPDDGSNTRKHYGNQRFFLRGLNKAVPDIVDRCIARMV